MEREYKMRAECSVDVGRFLIQVGCLSISSKMMEIDGAYIPDMEVTFTSRLSLAQLQKEIAKIEDGHVMFESLNIAEKYTGERTELGGK